MNLLTCYHCKNPHSWSATSKIERRDCCAKCLRDLRVCLNCQHYSPQANRECRETISERVNDKEKSNFCDLFSPRENTLGEPTSSKESLMSAAEALFKKK